MAVERPCQWRLRVVLVVALLVSHASILAEGSTRGSVRRSTRQMKVSNLFHGNVLPQYRWMCKMSGAEFAESGYCTVAGKGYDAQGPISPPCSAQVDPQCPDWAFDGLWADIRTMTLPYTVQDEYDRAHTPTDVPVLTLENDELTAVVTPQWGGRLWSLTSKSSGRELFYNNLHFQPTNDALRQAYQQGGSEWNFGPQIGHMSDTLTDVFAAALDTDRGTVLRVYAMERTTAAVWQVDMLLGNQSTLWLHVKLTNPRPEPIVGYWWTNVGVQVDTDGSNQTRILTPAKHWLSDAARAALPPWPFFYERSGGSMMMSATSFNSSQGDWTHPDFPQFDVKPTDMSYAFHWWEKRDVWFDLVESKRSVRYNGWVDQHGGLMLHGHPNNGTKAWMWGTAPDEKFWQNFGGGKDDIEDVPSDQHNMYTELQTGVMPTQYQGFPMQPQSTREWTEFFTTDSLDSSTLESLLSADYHGEAIPTADQLLENKGLSGNRTETYYEIDEWFKAHVADRKPTPQEILHQAERWGAVEELRRGGKPLASGTLFSTTTGDNSSPLQEETQAWLELVSAGTFSEQSLNSHAISFNAGGYRDVVGTSWLAVLNASAAKHGATWLHHFHMGVILLERTLVPGDSNFTKAKESFEESIAMKRSPEALRNLAIIAHAEKNHDLAFSYYYEALTRLVSEESAEKSTNMTSATSLLIRDIAAEATYQFALLGWSNVTNNLTQPGTIVPRTAWSTDRFRFGAVQAAIGREDWSAVFALLDCQPERLWPTLGWWGGGTLMLGEWYIQAKLADAVAKNGGIPLTQLQKNALYRSSPVPFCIRAAGH